MNFGFFRTQLIKATPDQEDMAAAAAPGTPTASTAQPNKPAAKTAPLTPNYGRNPSTGNFMTSPMPAHAVEANRDRIQGGTGPTWYQTTPEDPRTRQAVEHVNFVGNSGQEQNGFITYLTHDINGVAGQQWSPMEPQDAANFISQAKTGATLGAGDAVQGFKATPVNKPQGKSPTKPGAAPAGKSKVVKAAAHPATCVCDMCRGLDKGDLSDTDLATNGGKLQPQENGAKFVRKLPKLP